MISFQMQLKTSISIFTKICFSNIDNIDDTINDGSLKFEKHTSITRLKKSANYTDALGKEPNLIISQLEDDSLRLFHLLWNNILKANLNIF